MRQLWIFQIFLTFLTTSVTAFADSRSNELPEVRYAREALLPSVIGQPQVERDSLGRPVLVYLVKRLDGGIEMIRMVAGEAIVRLPANHASVPDGFALESLGSSSSFHLLRSIEPTSVPPGELVAQFERASGITVEQASPNLIGQLDGAQDRVIARDLPVWALENLGLGQGAFDADIDASEAISRLRGFVPPGPVRRDPIILMIDSSIDTTHPALVGQLWSNPGEVAGDGIDNEGNGRRDDVNGWNFVDRTGFLIDAVSHGTHVAGIMIAQPDPAQPAVRGTAIGASLMTAKVGATPTIDRVVQALNYGLEQHATVVNMSLSFPVSDPALFEAIEKSEAAGQIVVASAGNNGRDLRATPAYPCMYWVVVCVANSNQLDELETDSNWGARSGVMGLGGVAIAAPGNVIRSTLPGGLYGELRGTSMSAPFVTAGFAAAWRIYPQATPLELRQRLFETSDRIPTIAADRVEDGRRLNLYNMWFGIPRTALGSNAYCDEPIRDPQTGQSYPRRTNSPFANSGEPGIDGLAPSTAFTLCTVAQMVNIQEEMLDRFFTLRADLRWRDDTSGTGYQSIGARTGSPRGTFTGVIDGNGHRIEGLSQGLRPHGGLIWELGVGGRVTNLRFTQARVRSSGPAGTVATTMSGGRIDNIQIEGSVVGSNSVGGLVGQMHGGTITLSTFTGTVNGTGWVGGLIGSALGRGGSLRSSYFSGVIDGRIAVGGLIGRADDGFLVRQSHAAVSIPHVPGQTRSATGGLVGQLFCRARIEESYAEGDVHGNGLTGGLVGQMINADIVRAYASVLIGVDIADTGGAIGKITDGILGDNQRYQCSETNIPPPVSTRTDDFYDSHLGQTGIGTPRSAAALRNPTTFAAWPYRIWDMQSGELPRLNGLPRSTHTRY